MGLCCMLFVPILVNAIVICVLAAELVATSLGMGSPDQLLISSALSGLLTMLSFKLSQEALLHINSQQAVTERVEEDVSAGE
jgi:hypothetical protein